MPSSPPGTAEFIRHQSLSPASPRPQNVPSPANIPILVESMDPNFNEPSSYSNGTSTPAPQYTPQSHAPGALASTPYFADQSTANGQHVGLFNAGVGASMADQAAAFGSSMGAQAHDAASVQNYTQQLQAHAASGQDLHSAYPFSHDSAYAVQQASAQSAQGAHYQTAAQASTSVDVQALLDSLTPAANNAPSGHYAAPQMFSQSAQAQPNASSLPSATNLPPRPPAQDKPATHPNYNPSDDIRSYHPHSQQTSTAQPRGSAQPQPLNMSRQDFSTAPPSGATSPTVPNQAQRQSGQRSETPDDEDIRWPPEINRKYEEFLDQERKFVTEGQWDQFPMGSRLFIGKLQNGSQQRQHLIHATGNLPTEKVTKRDIFHRFYRHGRLAQISIKQAYGFVQFLDTESCRRALDAEQGQAVRGRKMRKWIDFVRAGFKSASDMNRPRNLKTAA